METLDRRQRATERRRQTAGDDAIVDILLLGPLQIRCDGIAIRLTGAKDSAFVSALASTPTLRLPRDRLAGLLWENSSERRARDSLKQSLLRLRRRLAPFGADVLCSDRTAIWFNRSRIRVDASEQEALLAASNLKSVEKAMNLRRGVFLEGQAPIGQDYDGWLHAERTRLDRLYVDALLGMMKQAEQTGRSERALELAQRILSADKENERAARCMMRVLSQNGDRRAALMLYESLRQRLNDDFAISPQPATVDLYNAIRTPPGRTQEAQDHKALNQVSQEQLRSAAPAKTARPELTGAALRSPVASSPKDPSPKDSSLNTPSINTPSPDATAPGTAPPGTADISIAVLPFDNLGPELVDDFFTDGLTEDIITELSGAFGISVASRNTTLAMKEHAIDAVQAARHFSVSHVLEGSVRREHARLRVTVRLIDGRNGHQIWAQRYDRGAQAVFALQDELSRDVAEVLKVKLSAVRGEDGNLGARTPGTQSLEAYEAFHKGRGFYLRGMNSVSLRVSRMLLARAIELDPGYALAYAQLAICESYLAMSLVNTNADSCFETCMAHSLRALELDPFLAEAHAGKGLAHYAAGEYDAAAVALEAAIRLDDSLFEAYFFQARNKHLLGQREEAAQLFERAAALRPNDFRAIGLLAEEYAALGWAEKARSAFESCLIRLKAEVENHPDNAGALAFGSAVLAHLGHAGQAEDWANWALAIGPDDCLIHYNSARTWMLLARPGDALSALESAFAMPTVVRRRLAMWMAFDTDLKPLSGDPRFDALLAYRSLHET